jgi:hypothetical protein
MVQRGTVLNGVIVPEGPPLPDGTKVLFEKEEVFDYPHPLAPYDEEKELALLRESLAEMDAGERGHSVEVVFAEIEKNSRRFDKCKFQSWSNESRATVIAREERNRSDLRLQEQRAKKLLRTFNSYARPS